MRVWLPIQGSRVWSRIREGLLSVTRESMCTKYWLTACPGKSVVRWTDRPAMTIAVDLGRKATKQTNKSYTVCHSNTTFSTTHQIVIWTSSNIRILYNLFLPILLFSHVTRKRTVLWSNDGMNWPLECIIKKLFSYFSTKTYVVGTQKNVSIRKFFWTTKTDVITDV